MNTIIEKIRAEVERLINECDGSVSQYGFGKMSACNRILNFLDTLQEQPVKELLTFDGFVDKVGSWFANLELRRFRKTFDGEIYPATELVQAYEWFVHELSEKYREKHPQEQPVKIDIRKELESIEFMGVNDARDTETIARHFYELGRQSKPTTAEGLEDVADTLAEEHGFVKKPDFKPAKYSWSAVRDVFIEGVLAGAKWQKEQTEKRWLEDRNGCFWDGVEEGKKAMREQMMKEAVEVEVTETCGISSVWIKTTQFKPGQKVKIIICKKED